MNTQAYEKRRQYLYDWMAREGIALVMFEDTEGKRDPSIRYLTGQPGDALLFLSVDHQAVLVPWDINLAQSYANADKIIPYTEFERHPLRAIKAITSGLQIPYGSRIEIPPITAYPQFLRFIETLQDYDVVCREGGAAEEVHHLRAIKDEEEIALYREAARLTNNLIDLLETKLREGSLTTEIDVALFIEAEARRAGCEGTGFETLAAGPRRSWGIHAFPTFTAEAFAEVGLSILDFGLSYQGYTTDVTLTIARGPLSSSQKRMISLVEKAYDLALSLIKPGIESRLVALAVDNLFEKNKKLMPHALGHGIGLEAHEGPAIRSRADNEWVLQPGMIFTLEPGLYDPKHGGCRLENDILLTERGPEVLTKARIMYL
ncbi:MAG: Xaa-Pro peptidase family protein [Treponemataceae bacterium]|nr:Xaa-Pro peptidase family protein [Treponemataceae bacterium]